MHSRKRELPAWLIKIAESPSTQTGPIPNGTKVFNTDEERPMLKFKGVINYCNTVGDCGMACENILEQHKNVEELILGFDMEWPVKYKMGLDKTALIQICADENVCYLFQVSNMMNLPLALTELLQHPKIKLVGINIESDLWKLSRDFAIIVKPIIDTKVVDLGVFANDVLKCKQTWSLERLLLHLMKMKIDKNGSIRESNWSLQPLSLQQQCYAATDAYASLLLYKDLKRRLTQ